MLLFTPTYTRPYPLPLTLILAGTCGALATLAWPAHSCLAHVGPQAQLTPRADSAPPSCSACICMHRCNLHFFHILYMPDDLL